MVSFLFHTPSTKCHNAPKTKDTQTKKVTQKKPFSLVYFLLYFVYIQIRNIVPFNIASRIAIRKCSSIVFYCFSLNSKATEEKQKNLTFDAKVV